MDNKNKIYGDFNEADKKDIPDAWISKAGVDKFDAESDGYDMNTAVEAGYQANVDGKWPSRDYRTGLILKGKQHETWGSTEELERAEGYKIVKRGDRYYSFKERFNKEDFKKVAKIYDRLDRSNQDTKSAQHVLKEYGFDLELDGLYGKNTKRAVTNFISKYSGDYMWDSMKSKVESAFD
jgi:hypothetical protein